MNPSEYHIFSIIPQRAPFVMIDALTDCTEKSARSVFFVSEKNILVEDGRLSEAGLVENIAQTAAARSGFINQSEKKMTQIGYIGDVKNLEISGLPKINDQLETEIIVRNQIFDITVIEGTVSCNKKLLAKCEMKIFISNQS